MEKKGSSLLIEMGGPLVLKSKTLLEGFSKKWDEKGIILTACPLHWFTQNQGVEDEERLDKRTG